MPSLGIAPHPEGCTGSGTMPAPSVTSASGAMPTDVTFRRLEIGVQAVQLSPYHTGPADASVQHLDLTVAFFWQAIVPFTFRIRVSHWTQEPPFEFLPAAPGIRQGASRRNTGSSRSICW